MSSLNEKTDFTTPVFLFEKDAKKRVIHVQKLFNGPEIASELQKIRIKFHKHRKVRDCANKNMAEVTEEYAYDKNAAILEQDYSMNASIRPMSSSQKQFMKPVSFLLHITILRYMGKKTYIYTTAERTTHPPEIPVMAVQFALNYLKSEYDADILQSFLLY